MLRDFRRLVSEKFKEEHSTSYYAKQLHITPDHLNRTIKGKIGKTAKEFINQGSLLRLSDSCVLLTYPIKRSDIHWDSMSRPTSAHSFKNALGFLLQPSKSVNARLDIGFS